VVVVLLFLLPIAAFAWIKVGPIAGLVALAWIGFAAYIRSGFGRT